MLELEAQTLYAVLIRLALAALMGGVIGLEREKARRSAGLRTHMLICLGAALIMCTGEYIFERYGGENNIDPARMGAQVVSGIGILCAGTIIKEGPTVRGLTTATGLWCASCIGIAVGSGNILPAAGATVIVLVILWLFRHIEERRLQNPIASSSPSPPAIPKASWPRSWSCLWPIAVPCIPFPTNGR